MARGRWRPRGRREEPAYPAHWEADIPLRDGTAAHLRPIRPEDADALQALHQSQSERSRYFRFFAPKPELSSKDLTLFTTVDHRDRVAFVVEIADELVAVARYDRVSETDAEVAFYVSDALHGRGLGSILLEHLAAAALENGISTFSAEVLPENRAMLSVFTEAGFDVRRQFDDGVILVDFAIAPTARTAEVRAERERRAEARTAERLLNPRTIMVVGASRDRTHMGAQLIRGILASGFEGSIFPVNPEAYEISGLKAYARISDVPVPVDLAVLAVRPEACIAAIPALAAAGVQGVVVIAGGFADAGAHGVQLQRDLVESARSHGMRLLGPASLGFFRNGPRAINVSLLPNTGRDGAVALAAQSTAMSAMLLAAADERGVALHEFVSAGNRADLSLNDMLQRWEDDDLIDVVALSLESLGNPRKFSRIARRITAAKPLLVLRPPGEHQTAPPGHQVRQTPLPRAAFDQVIASSGAIHASTVDHLLDLIDVFAREGTPRGTRLGLIANSPGLGALLRGAADEAGLEVTAENFSVPMVGDRRFIPRAFTAMAGPDTVDIVVVGIIDPLTIDLRATARELEVLARGAAVQVVLVVTTDADRMRTLRSAAAESGSMPPVFALPSRALRAVHGLVTHAQRAASTTTWRDEIPGLDGPRVRAVISEPAPGPAQPLSSEDAASVLAAYGIHVLPSTPVSTAEEARAAAEAIGYPVALKSADPVLRHRLDAGAVQLNIQSPDGLTAALAAMREDLPGASERFLVQTMAPAGVSTIVRSTEDPSLGPVVSFSIAGDSTEYHRDIAYAIPPLSRADAASLIREPAAAHKLVDAVGGRRVDVQGLEDLIQRISALAEDHPMIASVELNPVMVTAHGVRVIDAQVMVRKPDERLDSIRRALLPAG